MIGWYARQSRFVVIWLFHQLYTSEPQSKRRCNTACCLPLILRRGVPKHHSCLEAWKGLLQQLKALRGKLDLLQKYTRGTPARSSQALDVSTRKRIIFGPDHYDRHGIASRKGCLHGALVGSNDNINFLADQLLDCSWDTIGLLFRVQIVCHEILAFNIAKFA
jgi:hypothetical protein